MNCRNFERHTADWLNQSLSPERSREMAAHGQNCPACARAVLTEAQLRAAWQDIATAPPAADLWPRLALRLDALDTAGAPTPPERLSLGLRKPRWALAAAIALTTLGFCRWELFSSDRMPHGQTRTGHAAPGLPNPRVNSQADLSASAALHEADSWSVLGDVSQNTALVDDPVGVSTDNIWTYLKTDGR